MLEDFLSACKKKKLSFQNSCFRKILNISESISIVKQSLNTVKIQFLNTCGSSPDKLLYNSFPFFRGLSGKALDLECIECHLAAEPTHKGNSYAYRVAEKFNSNPNIFPFRQGVLVFLLT